ncbi:ABC transporter permease [Bythopirellula polymerisocia]|uniref:ABC transporter permease YtrF n=1 Tax=Bythopirellula polymerisocia TaxID=2528003 RepID=A0A5C6CX13_9BACT|nr:FtsX-like permease family protein [Bythopirellula polymerisocia]TWU28234.1 ABC transporter permease YtrF precursor [Bythopirellula polymerisocia]
MSFWKIAWRNMCQRALASSLTGLSMALGVALMILVIVIHDVTVEQFENDAQGYHLIVGGSKGGDLQLVMTTVFHLGRPLYPIPYSYYKKFTEGEFAPYTKVAVPYCLGDSFQGGDQQFRVVATTPDLFDKLPYGANPDGTDKLYQFQEGRNFKADHFFESVIGSTVARKTGLKVGDKFQPTHGMSASGDKHTEFTVVGILDHTGTANDRAVFANIEGFYLLEGHALSTDEGEVAHVSADKLHKEHVESDDPNYGLKPLPEAQREVTSILVNCKDEFGPMILDTKINKDKERIAQAVAPGGVVTRLLEGIVGPVRIILMVLTVLIIVVAGVSILVSIYNSMSERSHDIAVMRALGASRTAVMGIILAESILLSLLGGLAGVLLGHALLGLASPYVEEHTGVALRFWDFNWKESLLIPGLVVFASLVGFLPALTAYRTDVGRILGGGR